VQAALLMMLVVLPWFVLVLRAHGMRVLDYMFVDQVFKRAVNDSAAAAATGRSFGRPQSLYVLRHFLEYGQPWSLLIWPALWHAWRGSRRLPPEKSMLLRLSVLWFATVMLLFLLSRGRWSWYISSVYIPVALLVAVLLRDFVSDPGIRAAPLLWVTLVVSAWVSSTPYTFDPYGISSGGFPLKLDLVRQVLVVGLVGMATTALWPRRGLDPGDRRVTLVVTVVPVVTLAMVIYYVHCARVPSLEVMLPVHALAGFLVAGFGIGVLMMLRADRRARIAAVTCAFFIAGGYVAAPLHHSHGARERQEIEWVRNGVVSGEFRRSGELTMSPVSLFSFIPIYATFRNDYVVSYDTERRAVRVVSKLQAAKSSNP
jgi:hypothetical protein